MEVKVIHLKRYFGRTKAVDDISFRFESGQIFGFVGPNGAGKTTTMRIMATLDDPTDGDVQVNGTSVVIEPEKARRMLGYMPDNLPTHRDMSVDDYLDFFARAYGVPSHRRRAAIEGIEEFTRLKGIRGKYIKALSKGMKQRVSLARSLIHDPPALVMDEPAAGLDPRARIELRELLKALADQGKAILVSSHILTELEEICDGAVIIELGKILRAGTMAEFQKHDVPRRTVVIRPLARAQEVYKELLVMPNVESARFLNEQIEADISGSEEAGAEVLSALIQKGFQIVEFRQQRADLEDIFMNVTRGEVQ